MTSTQVPDLLDGGYISQASTDEIKALCAGKDGASITVEALNHIITLDSEEDPVSTSVEANTYLPGDGNALGPKTEDALGWWFLKYLLPSAEGNIPYLYLDPRGLISTGLGINVSKFIGWDSVYSYKTHRINNHMIVNAYRLVYGGSKAAKGKAKDKKAYAKVQAKDREIYGNELVTRFKAVFLKRARVLCSSTFSSNDVQTFCSEFNNSNDNNRVVFYQWDAKQGKYDIPLKMSPKIDIRHNPDDKVILRILTDFAEDILKGPDKLVPGKKKRYRGGGYGMGHDHSAFDDDDNIGIAEPVTDSLSLDHVKNDFRLLHKYFGDDYTLFPAGAQLALLDIAYNAGPSSWAPGQPGHHLYQAIKEKQSWRDIASGKTYAITGTSRDKVRKILFILADEWKFTLDYHGKTYTDFPDPFRINPDVSACIPGS